MAVLGLTISHGDKTVVWPGLPFLQYERASKPAHQLTVSPNAVLVKDREPGFGEQEE